MTRIARHADRPTPAFRQGDGAPWPTDDELDLDAEWAALRESGDVEWWTDAEPAPTSEAPCLRAHGAQHAGTAEHDPSDDVTSYEQDDLTPPLDGAAYALSDLDARLGHLECVVGDRQRATAEEYRLILAILDDAAADPTPWVGPDPTLDRAWRDSRGRRPGAVGGCATRG